KSPTPLPAARSICPARMTRSIPMASVAVTLSSMASIETLRAARKAGVSSAKKTAMASHAPAIAACRKTRLRIRGSERRPQDGLPRGRAPLEGARRTPVAEHQDARRDEQKLFQIARDEHHGHAGVE